jgi:hypothetical protein
MSNPIPDNYIKAVELFRQILMENYVNPDDRERFLLDLSYYKMLESLGNAFLYEQTSGIENTPNLSPLILSVIEVQDKLITEAIGAGNYNLRFSTNIDKANVLRLAERRDLAISLLNEMDSWVLNDERDYFELLKCDYDLEQKVINREITVDDFLEMKENCTGNNSNRMAQNSSNIIKPLDKFDNTKQDNQIEDISISPNPVNDLLTLMSTIENGEIIIFNSIGEKVFEEKFNSEAIFDLSKSPNGIYLLHIIDSDTNKIFEKRIIHN